MTGTGLAPAKLPIGKEEVAEAAGLLRKYKDGKANLETRVVEDELWWELRHWEAIRRTGRGCRRPEEIPPSPKPTSAWLFNVLLGKHADAMDNIPEPAVLPRERSDEESAKLLSSVLPVILDGAGFEGTYSGGWWEKLKHGTACYGVFWDPDKENGLGDIEIREIDLLKIYWEPGITDIQDSRNLFIVELMDRDLLEQEYPEKKGKLGGNAIDVKQYLYDDQVDTSEKVVVADWYYKRNLGGRTVVHYAKFVGDELLYASENDPAYAERGYYDHGLYPVVFDTLYPEKGTPAGFGFVAVCKDPQLYIDSLSGNILENSMMGSKRRYLVNANSEVNEDELLNWNKPIVHVTGELDERRIRPIECPTMPEIYANVLNMKIEELKETSANRDMSNGGTASGVTAAAAIAALQEAGNKSSRDMISASYRAYTKVLLLVIELIRQFYDEARTFRVVAPNGDGYDFAEFSNAPLQEQVVGTASDGSPLIRKPIFDLKLKAQKKNPFSRMEQNERAKELYQLGFFSPERAQESLIALDMMDFEGIDKVKEKVQEGQTLLEMCQQLAQQVAQLSAIVGLQAPPMPGMEGGPGAPPTPEEAPASSPITDGVMQSQTPMTGYGQRLAKRSTPSVE